MIKNVFNYFNFSQNVLVFLLLVSFWGAIVYRVYALNWTGVIFSLILVIITYGILHYFIKKFNPPTLKLRRTSPPFGSKTWSSHLFGLKFWRTIPFEKWWASFLSGLKQLLGVEKTNRIFNLLIPFYIFLVAIGLFVLSNNSTSKSIISPWEVLPGYFFFIYFLATFILLFLLIYLQKNKTILLMVHLFFSFSVIWLVYRLGYGYDFFIHNATLGLIDEQGFVLPKPNYYLGQYSLIIILHKILALPIHWLNLLLVPVMAVFLLPVTLVNVLKKQLNYQHASLTSCLLLILPFSILTFTTPQNFAYLLLLLIIIYGLNWQDQKNYLLIGLLSLTALAVHPIVGFPAIFFLLITIFKHDFKLKKYLISTIFIFTVISLPATFYLLEKNSISFADFSFANLIELPGFNFPAQDDVILNLVYLYGQNLIWIVLLLIVVGTVIYYKTNNKEEDYRPYLVIGPALLLSYLLAKLLPFNYLINYERSDFADRIFTVAIIFFLPFVLLALHSFVKRMLAQKKYVQFSWLLIFSLLISSSFYLSYPRYDKFFNSHGYSVGNFDVEAVRYINDNAGKDYIVLANQQVSAAALSQFGFNKYYKNKIFYYPVPTSGLLYGYYLDMVYKKPARETIIEAMNLAGVNEAYFVLNKYWYASPKILEESKLEADSWQSIGNGEVFVFKYQR